MVVQNEKGKTLKTDLSNGQLYLDDDDEDSDDDDGEIQKSCHGAMFHTSKLTRRMSAGYARPHSKVEI